MLKHHRSFVSRMPAWIVLAFVFSFFTGAQPAHAATDCANADVPQAECEALLDLYTNTDGANWTQKSGWGQTDTVCSWFGVGCYGGPNVASIGLLDNNLSGTIPNTISNLTELEGIDLWGNHLTGTIPDTIGNLEKLMTLDLSGNNLSGPIPTSLGNLIQLYSLQLHNNMLSGPIPDTIGNLTYLEELALYHNNLSGSIPTSISNLTNLVIVDLSFNELDGTIPDAFINLTNLHSLDLSNNMLSGSIPNTISNLTNLDNLDFSYNQFTSLPESLMNVTGNFRLDINYNQFDENAMSTTLAAFVDAHAEANWRATQTLPPTNVQVTATTANSVTLSWSKRGEDTYPGRFEVGVSTSDGGPYTFDAANFTADKDTTTLTVNGLTTGTPSYFVVRKNRFAIPDTASESTSKNSAQVSATPSGSIPDPTNPPSKPALVSPENNAVIVGELPVLVWNVNPAAQQVNRYRVTVRDSANQVVDAVNVLPSSCTTTCELDTSTFGVAFKNVKYTWQVEARNVKGTRLSDIRAFTMQLPGRPVLLAPIDTTTSPTPTFTWELRGAPLEYRVEIFNAEDVRVYQSATFEPLATFGCATAGDTCTFILPTNLANGVHTWRVIARNTSDFSGLTSISAVKTFTVSHPFVPTITAPKEDVSLNVAKPVMRWNDTLNGANVEYRINIRKASDNKPAYVSGWLNRTATLCDADTECEFMLDSALTNGAYNWFLQVRETIGSVTYVKRTPGFAAFKLLFPDRPVPQSPTETIVNTPTPTFVWGEVTNATEYRVLVRDATTRKSVYNSGWQTVTCVSAMCELVGTKALPNAAYQWRIEARNIAEAPNIVSSGWRNFTVKSPGVASNLAGDITGTLTWDAAANATGYRVLIQRTPANTAIYTGAWFPCADPACAHTPGVTFANGHYRWRVQARNVNGTSLSAWATQSLP